MKTEQPEIIRKLTAFHESWHVIADSSFGYRFIFVTIKPNDLEGYNGIVYGRANGRACDLAVVQLAGIVATAKLIGCDPWDNPYLFGKNNPDITTADKLIDQWGDYLLKTYGKHLYGRQIWNEIENKTRLLVNQNWKPIEIIAGALLKIETLSYDDVIWILKAQCPDYMPNFKIIE